MKFTENVTRNYHENLVRLLQGIQDAGGGISHYGPETTLHEFLMACSTNSIKLTAEFDSTKVKKHER
jgi:hypothetical protein